jgi:hypothetical protein
VKTRAAVRVLLACVLVVGVVACSDDDKGSSDVGGNTPAGETLPPGQAAPSDSSGPTTTLMPDCGSMPTPAELTALVGVPIDTGRVTSTGSCEFVGLNDQSRFVLLTFLDDPTEQADMIALQESLGVTPLNDPALPNAMVSSSSVVYVVTDAGIYTVQTLVTDAPAAEQAALSVAVLKQWLALGA